MLDSPETHVLMVYSSLRLNPPASIAVQYVQPTYRLREMLNTTSRLFQLLKLDLDLVLDAGLIVHLSHAHGWVLKQLFNVP
jgi:hypothetical protein